MNVYLRFIAAEARVQWITEPYRQLPANDRGRLPSQHRAITLAQHVETVRGFVATIA